MRRVPLPIAILLILSVVPAVWWLGVRDMDFMTPPNAAQLEMARTRATQELARPSELFAVAGATREPPLRTNKRQPNVVQDDDSPPFIPAGNLDGSPAHDSWLQYDHPAASYIDLASRLESEARLSWARGAWERVIDHCQTTPDELMAAIKGVLRTRASAPDPPDPTPDGPVVEIVIHAPSDRSRLASRATTEAAETLQAASDNLIRFKPKTRAGGSDSQLTIALSVNGKQSELQRAAPAEVEAITRTILAASYELIASRLATHPEVNPLTTPLPGEKPSVSLHTRITRRAWRVYANSFLDPS